MTDAQPLQVDLSVTKGSFELEAKLSVPPQGITAIFGASGAGKTTLLRALAGLEPTAVGQLQWGDTVWQSPDIFVPTYQRHVGYVFQEPSLFPHLSVAGNLLYGFKRRHKKASTTQDLSHPSHPLAELISLLKLGPLLDRKASELSGGERQRVAIARALATKPKLLLMDEPLSSQSQVVKNELFGYLEQLPQSLGVPVLYVTHSIDEVARLADHLVFMNAGRVQAQGEVNALFTRLDMPLAHLQEATSMIDAQVQSFEEDYAITCLGFSGGELQLVKSNLALGDRVRVAICARDVSITLQPPQETSILNVLPAVVTELVDECNGQVVVQLRVGEERLLARITCKSAQHLDLAPGKPVFAQIKSIALIE